MTERGSARKLPMPGLVAAVLITAGVLSWLFLSRGLLILAGVGAFGPGLLREMGWLRDRDEFQREAAHRAGYHAYLAGGLAALLALSVVEWRGGEASEPAEWIRFVVVVLWLTWLSSTLITYWGPRVTTARVLRVFGSFWAVFVLASLAGGARLPRSGAELVQGLLGVAVGVLVVAPFFVLAWTARRWPRATALWLLGMALVFVGVFGLRRHTPLATTALTLTLLIGPLAVTGLALLLDWGGDVEVVE